MTVVIDGTTGIDTIQNGTVTSAKIVDGAVGGADLSGQQSGNPPVYGARAWCVFDGTLTGTNAPTAGGNVASVTRTSTGNYTINFTTAMPDTNYSIICMPTTDSVAPTFISETGTGASRTTSAVLIQVNNNAGTASDRTKISVAIFR